MVDVETEDLVQKAEAPIASSENDKGLKVLNQFLEFLGDGRASIHRDRATCGEYPFLSTITVALLSLYAAR